MSTWALIVIVALNTTAYPRGGTSIAVVNGFTGQPSCIAAGLQVQKSSQRALEFACVEVK